VTTIDGEAYMRMAHWMKDQDKEIVAAIHQTMKDNHGVVALKFRDGCREMDIEILDEPFDDNVRVYPG
jgi:hypothetical protein